MNFKTKVTIRLITSIAYIIIGLAMIALCILTKDANEILRTIGIVLAVMGTVRTVQYLKISKDKESMHSHEIAEKDERNIMLMYKARSLAFAISIWLGGIAIVILYLMNLAFAGQIIAYSICAVTIIYMICYAVIRRKY